MSRLTAANNLARLSVSMLSLSLLVAVTQVHGYAAAGLLTLVYAITNAAAGPVRGRLADRFRPRVVLLALLPVHVVAFVLLYVALAAPMAVLVVACLLLGAGHAGAPANDAPARAAGARTGAAAADARGAGHLHLRFSVMWLGFGLGTTVAGQVSSSGETSAALMTATAGGAPDSGTTADREDRGSVA